MWRTNLFGLIALALLCDLGVPALASDCQVCGLFPSGRLWPLRKRAPVANDQEQNFRDQGPPEVGEPVPPPTLVVPSQAPTGVDWDKIPKAREYFLSEGREVPRKELEQFIEQKPVPDDHQHPFITIIAKDAKAAKQVYDDFLKASELQEWSKAARIQAFSLDNRVHREMLKDWDLENDPQFEASGMMIAYQQAADPKGAAKVEAIFKWAGGKKVRQWLDRVAGEPRAIPGLKINVSHSVTIPPAAWVLAGVGGLSLAGFALRKK
jgi:hypothetical protein